MLVEWYWWLLIAAGVLAFLWLLQRLRLIDLRGTGRRGGGAGGLMSLGDEIFAPTRHEAAQEVAREAVLPAPAPIPGDGPGDVLDGPLVIHVDDAGDAGGADGTGDAEARGKGRHRG